MSGGIALAVSACGGGGSDTPATTTPTPTPTISGTVTSVAATVAQLRAPSVGERLLALLMPSATAEMTGTQPVSGATVELVQLTDGGAEVAVVASATTDGGGAYQLSSAQGADPHFMLRVRGSTEQLRAPLTGAAVDLSPASEAIMSRVLTRVGGATPLSNFSVAELRTMVEAAAALNVDLGSATTVAEALVAIDGADSNLDDLVISMESASDNGAAISGTYHGIGFAGFLDAAPKYALSATTEYSWMGGGVDLGTESIVVDSAAASIGFSATSTADSLQQGFVWNDGMFTGPDVATVSAGSAETSSATVSYLVGDDNRVYFSGVPSVLNGAVSGDGKVCAVTDVSVENLSDGNGGAFREAYRGLHVFIKAATVAPDVTASSYNIVELETVLGTAELSGSMMIGTAAFDGANFTTSTNEEKVTLALGGTLAISSAPLAVGPVPYTLAADGSLSIDNGVGSGYATDDGGMVVIGADLGTGDRGLVLGIRQTSGASVATLNGSYNVLLVGGTLQDATPVSPAADSNVGGTATLVRLTFDGAGNGSLAAGSEAFAESSAAGGDARLTLSSTAIAPASFTYSVNGLGTFTLSGLEVQVRGAVSQDGSKLVVAVKDYGAGAHDPYGQSIGIGLR